MAVLGRLQPFVAVTQSIAIAMPAKGNLRPQTVIHWGLARGPLPDQEAVVGADPNRTFLPKGFDTEFDPALLLFEITHTVPVLRWRLVDQRAASCHHPDNASVTHSIEFMRTCMSGAFE